jgi:hypothetical protein
MPLIDLPALHFRFRSLEHPDRLAIWFQYGDQPERGPAELNVAEFEELVALFERADAVIRRALARMEEDRVDVRPAPLLTDPFALRDRRPIEDGKEDDD